MKLVSRKNFLFFQNFHVDKRVIKPLQTLLESFQGPTRLIMKRQDKHIDFSASTQRAEKNKDPSKNKMVILKIVRISLFTRYFISDIFHLFIYFYSFKMKLKNVKPHTKPSIVN